MYTHRNTHTYTHVHIHKYMYTHRNTYIHLYTIIHTPQHIHSYTHATYTCGTHARIHVYPFPNSPKQRHIPAQVRAYSACVGVLALVEIMDGHGSGCTTRGKAAMKPLCRTCVVTCLYILSQASRSVFFFPTEGSPTTSSPVASCRIRARNFCSPTTSNVSWNELWKGPWPSDWLHSPSSDLGLDMPMSA